MKKLTIIAMIAMMFSAGALASNERSYPKFEYKGFEINKKIIKTFCDDDNMCSDFIALESTKPINKVETKNEKIERGI